jgi:N-methylhydantoinase A
VVEEKDGLRVYKSPTTPDDPAAGVLDVLEVAAADLGRSLGGLLGEAEALLHATTYAINAIVTARTGRCAFLTTEGHPDILLFREGGRDVAFDFSRSYPEPYVPRALTFEVPERIGPGGEIVEPLDRTATEAIVEQLAAAAVEAVSVCLLWSISNPKHELEVARLLDARLPGVPYTLSHQLNPIIREYRRASATAIDASLKPIMTRYLAGLAERLRSAGFAGRLLVVTSAGGVLDASTVAQAPIHAVRSGPAMAPIAGRHFARRDAGAETAIVTDAGGTTFDVSLVRRGEIPFTQEAWIGPRYTGHMTGFPSVDVKSIGAGGGSIAWVDDEGLLHVGPMSAGAVPGPACYLRGGGDATLTDAAVALGLIDPERFLGGTMRLDRAAATAALERNVGRLLGLEIDTAAAAVMELTSEQMVKAILGITLEQGIDPSDAVLIAGGGAAGLNAARVARRLGGPLVVVPEVTAVLSAAGALLADLRAAFAITVRATDTERFDFDSINRALATLENRCAEFIAGPGAGAVSTSVSFSAYCRYPEQVWDLELPLRVSRFDGDAEVETLAGDFHRLHAEVFGISDDAARVEIMGLRASASCQINRVAEHRLLETSDSSREVRTRSAFFPRVGRVEAPVHALDSLGSGTRITGPAIVESPVTTVVIDVEDEAERSDGGSLLIRGASGIRDAARERKELAP